jgi:glucose/arabinose dehydrogenase
MSEPILHADRRSSLPRRALLVPGLLLLLTSGCYSLRQSLGGGQTTFTEPRVAEPAHVAVPAGYRVDVVANGLTFPSGLAFDGAGRLHVLEAGYSYGEEWDVPRLLRLEPDGGRTVVAQGTNPPWNGVAWHDGAFYVAEGGTLEGGRILRITPDGVVTALADGLPSFGDHHTNGPAIGPDGWIYFGQGTATNSGVVGPDNHRFGWLQRFPEFHDVPCRDVTLAGRNFRSPDPVAGRAEVETGAFVPFGTPTTAGQVVAGRVPCSGAILRVRPDGGPVELVAWGLRNPFGLAFSPDGRLFAADNSYDERGSRPVWGTGDLLHAIEPGGWYGWPDFHGERPLTDRDHFGPPGGAPPGFILAAHPGAPPPPIARLGVHSASVGMDFDHGAFGHPGHAFIAQFGDMAPGAGKVLAPVGFKVVRVDVARGTIHDFAVNRGTLHGPASFIGGHGLERPVDVRFHPAGSALYILDFGVMTMDGSRPLPRRGTGVVWRVTRAEGGAP